jgi:hypothetical protein
MGASFYQLSPYLRNAPLYGSALRWPPLLLALAGAACLCQIATLPRSGRGRSHDPRQLFLVRLATLAAASTFSAIGLHSLLVWRFHLLWPLNRTGLYIPPLCALAVATIAAITVASKLAAILQRVVLITLLAIVCYFVLCLRLTWFDEWSWNANSDKVYEVVAWYNHRYNVRDIATNWRYVAVLNFYRQKSGWETLHQIKLENSPYPKDRPLYVLFAGDDQWFISAEGLKIVYHDPLSDSVVAIRPEIERGSL